MKCIPNLSWLQVLKGASEAFEAEGVSADIIAQFQKIWISKIQQAADQTDLNAEILRTQDKLEDEKQEEEEKKKEKEDGKECSSQDVLAALALGGARPKVSLAKVDSKKKQKLHKKSKKRRMM